MLPSPLLRQQQATLLALLSGVCSKYHFQVRISKLPLETALLSMGLTRGNMGHEPELKFWMKFRMKYWMTGFETFDFFAWFFQYLDIQFQAHAEK